MALTSKFSVSLDALLTSALDLTTVSAPVERRAAVRLTSGTGAGQADKMWSDTRSLATGASEDLDLAGVLTDPFGATITFARVKGLYIKAADANTTNLTVGANVTSAWGTLFGPTGASGGTVTLRPGGLFVAVCGAADATAWAVTATSGDLLHVVNAAGATASYDIVIVGASV